jgi:hypothetical protein
MWKVRELLVTTFVRSMRSLEVLSTATSLLSFCGNFRCHFTCHVNVIMDVLVGEEHTTLVNSDIPDLIIFAYLLHCVMFLVSLPFWCSSLAVVCSSD